MLTADQLMDAYYDTVQQFDLTADQRDDLDDMHDYSDIMQAAHEGDWDTAKQLLTQEGIL